MIYTKCENGSSQTYPVRLCRFCGRRLYPFLQRAVFNVITTAEAEYEVVYPICECRLYKKKEEQQMNKEAYE